MDCARHKEAGSAHCGGGGGKKQGRGLSGKVRKIIYGNVTLLGIASLAWLIIRSGRKPSRLNYPCQKAAVMNVGLLFGGVSIPLAARLPSFLGFEISSRRYKLFVRAAEGAVVVALLVVLAVTFFGGPGPVRSMDGMRAAAATLTAPAWKATSGAAGTSDIFVAQNIPNQSEYGVDTLIDTMSANGQDFFKMGTAMAGKAAGPGGVIGTNDVVLIKVNGEWQERGGTNTDVVKGLVNAIVHHPGGFTGEIVIVENGQWASFMDNLPNNRTDKCNAEDHHQSFNDVATMFAGAHRVSVYDWTQVQTRSVGEFGSGDGTDGYVYVPAIEEGYPKFTTVYGTQISLRYGVWNGSSYDNSRLKFLNVPVLKDHGGPGMTASIKHFMGVQDLWKGTQDAPHGPMVTEGIFGKVMLVARFPDMNIVDAIWVIPSGGPNGPYSNAVRTNMLLASKDPVALDHYCAKHVLLPVSGDVNRHDPDRPNQLNQMQASTRDVLVAGGKQATMDESKMNVYTGVSPDVPPGANYQYFLAEGCTAYGFETWVLVANPNDSPANVTLSYYTDAGPRNGKPLQVPAHSRLTVNAASDIWGQNAGIRVGSDLPVRVERSMYWNNRIEGHDSIGTDAGSNLWYMAEGCTDYGFETWVCMLNPGATQAGAKLFFLTPAGQVEGPSVAIPPYSRRTVRVNDFVKSSDVSTRVETDGNPVVAELSMYGNNRRSGTCSIGDKAASADWYFAEGADHSGFESYVLLLNPHPEPMDVNIDAQATDPWKGSTHHVPRTITVPGLSRATVKLAELAPGLDVAVHASAARPFVASRSVYWNVPGGRAGHESTGVSAPATEVFMPEGCTAYGFETWLLVENPGASGAKVTVYAMGEGGEKKLTDMDVAAGTRASMRVNDYFHGNLSLRVTSTQPVVCERSVYWNNKGGGTCAPGYAP